MALLCLLFLTTYSCCDFLRQNQVNLLPVDETNISWTMRRMHLVTSNSEQHCENTIHSLWVYSRPRNRYDLHSLFIFIIIRARWDFKLAKFGICIGDQVIASSRRILILSIIIGADCSNHIVRILSGLSQISNSSSLSTRIIFVLRKPGIISKILILYSIILFKFSRDVRRPRSWRHGEENRRIGVACVYWEIKIWWKAWIRLFFQR